VRRSGAEAEWLVDGKPYIMLGGELHNSSASSAAYMEPIWKKLVALHLNTVIGTASWELVEPEPGKYDFALVDAQIEAARQHGMHLVLIWFATWKNANSSYAPMWVKQAPARFPLIDVRAGTGKRSVGTLSPLGEASCQADGRAFAALMGHIRRADPGHTVVLIQVENESGLLGDSRDRSPLAEAAWAGAVPAELLAYLEKHKAELLPEVAGPWGAHGYRTSGTWAEVFGADAHGEEIFMAWFVGRYVGRVAEAGKRELALPMYANAWLGPQPRQDQPGQYPSGGPVTGMLDIWRAAAPALDFFAPDIYVADFAGVCAGYRRSGNPLFIPEARASVPNLVWALGHDAALGYSPFGIEDLAPDDPLAAAYDALTGLLPLLAEARQQGKVIAVVEGNDESAREFERATGLRLRFGGREALSGAPTAKKEQMRDLPPAPGAGDPAVRPQADERGSALVLLTGPGEFVIAGAGVVVGNAEARLGTIDEGRFQAGRWIAGRRLNGDESFDNGLFTLRARQLEMRKVRTYRLPE
jgi:hypothetical protein